MDGDACLIAPRADDGHDRGVCRWNAYFGQPVMIDELLFKTQHGLIDQSLHSRMGVETTNGDGFGLGWYGGNGGAPGSVSQRHAGLERRQPA